MPFNSDPEGKRLPIKLDSTSNGEFVPIPLDATNRRANRLAQTWASENAKRRGVDRRTFMVSACGAASTLLAFNAANAAAGRTGGFFELERVAAVGADEALGDAVALGLAHEGRRGLDAEEGDLALEVVGVNRRPELDPFRH